jgi:hypothetical protein
MGEREDTPGGRDNPFARALDLRREDPELSRLRPVKPDLGESPLKANLTRTVADLGIADPELVEKNPKVAALTVNDLNDLAAEVSGVPSHNPKVADLTIDDMQDLEGVFLEFKLNASRQLLDAAGGGRFGVAATDVDVSCCCCTPCCCCAAAEVEPIRA